MKTLYATCIKPYECDGIVLYRKGQVCEIKNINDANKTYNISNGKEETEFAEHEFTEYFKKIDKLIRIEFKADFSTDDDFHFDETNLKEFESSMSNGAIVDYAYEHPFSDDISFCLIAEGAADACRWTLRDLIQEMMVSIRTYTLKHYLIKEIYELLEKFYDVIWDSAPISMTEYISGNYDGTEVYLNIQEVEHIDLPQEKPDEPTNSFIEITVQDSYLDPSSNVGYSYGDVKKLQCPHCKAIHPHSSYVRSFSHCPSCGKAV